MQLANFSMWWKRLELVAFCSLIALSVAGGAIRFINLDKKEFWHDESYTALVLSGHTTKQLADAIASRVVCFSELTAFRTVGESSTIQNTLTSLIGDEPGHAPLFYLIASPFCRAFGTTPFTMRFLSALFSVLTLPVIFWLARETYNSRVLAALTTAFSALSPFFIYYAQEARDYSLGIFWMFLSSALLLYALRTAKAKAWAGYALALSAGLYSWLFTAVLAGGQLLYMFISQGLNWKTWRPFILSLAACTVLFTPWLIVLHNGMGTLNKAYEWIQPPITPIGLLNVWFTIPYKAFALFGFKTDKLSVLLLIITLLEVCAVSIAASKFPSTKYLQLSIIAVWFVVFGGADLVLGGARSAPFRFQTLVIGSTIILFPALIQWLWAKRPLAVRFVCIVTVVFVFWVEVISAGFFLQSKIWPDKAISMRFTYPIAVRLNQEKEPVIACEQRRINLAEILDLSVELNPDCRLLFLTKDAPQPIPKTLRKIYLWNPSDELQTELSLSGYTIEDNIDSLPYLKMAVRAN